MKTLEVSQIAEALFHEALLGLVQTSRLILQEISQHEKQKFVDRRKSTSKLFLGRGTYVGRQPYFPHLSHARSSQELNWQCNS